MNPVTALGVASAVVSFFDFGVKVAKKLAEYHEASHGEIPRSLVSINTRLPLLVSALSRIQNEATMSEYDIETRGILSGVVLGCLKLVRELDDIMIKLQPKNGESLAGKLKKAMSSLKSQERINDIDYGLQGYI